VNNVACAVILKLVCRGTYSLQILQNNQVDEKVFLMIQNTGLTTGKNVHSEKWTLVEEQVPCKC
jgi:hypothetical protein